MLFLLILMFFLKKISKNTFILFQIPHIFHLLFTCTSALSMVHVAPAELMLAERNTDGKIEDVPDKVSNVAFIFHPENICSELFMVCQKYTVSPPADFTS